MGSTRAVPGRRLACITVLIAVLPVLVLLQGCLIGDTYIEDHTAEGAGYGAAAGAVTGAAVADYNGTSRWQGAAYGAAGGAVVGGVVGSQIPPDQPPQTGAGVSVVPVERTVDRSGRP